MGNVGDWDTDLISEVTDARSEQASADSAYQAAEEAWESARSDYATSIEMAWTTLSGDLEGRPSPDPELRTNRWADGESADDVVEEPESEWTTALAEYRFLSDGDCGDFAEFKLS